MFMTRRVLAGVAVLVGFGRRLVAAWPGRRAPKLGLLSPNFSPLGGLSGAPGGHGTPDTKIHFVNQDSEARNAKIIGIHSILGLHFFVIRVVRNRELLPHPDIASSA